MNYNYSVLFSFCKTFFNMMCEGNMNMSQHGNIVIQCSTFFMYAFSKVLSNPNFHFINLGFNVTLPPPLPQRMNSIGLRSGDLSSHSTALHYSF